ncbi:hypothetical protein B4U37_21635 (plasmid) [Sutcliffiella horikoshii]|uniref:Membrane insertase YidC/Oxa/ALB C-terminal domain-containing protein n=1 Tax=Sutcliffiella horikoshii TaxID=79883 RepID=A0ABM6KQT9_9BACI|nr:YidC/Oxa1 family membrane protein insertase [Sutcliffiella horikoshii]ART78716.1 hypothetical protein B4U37_21635 [Sutcliffiella horikoshii]
MKKIPLKNLLILTIIMFSVFFLKDLFLFFMELLVIPLKNYGLTIIVITLFIKLAITPLTFKDDVSNKKKVLLKNKFEKLEQKYRLNLKDEKLSTDIKEEINSLKNYYHINSFSLTGCLSLIFQLVVFYSWYRTISDASNIHEEKFMWLTLGNPDKYYVFPIVFFVLTIISFYISGIINNWKIWLVCLILSVLICYLGSILMGGYCYIYPLISSLVL